MIHWHFQSWRDFWAMGGQAVFVWSSYGLVLVAFTITVLVKQRRLKKVIRQLRLKQEC